jgi:hypothetical protein
MMNVLGPVMVDAMVTAIGLPGLKLEASSVSAGLAMFSLYCTAGVKHCPFAYPMVQDGSLYS